MSINERVHTNSGNQTAHTVWADRRVAVPVAVLIAALWAVAAGLWTPRGPLTTGAAVWSILISLVVGGLVGLLLNSRWAMLVAPAVFVVAFEITRMGVDGPMVDGLHASFYGAIALITGRGFQALLTLVPMALGAALGAGWARARTGQTRSRWSLVLGRGGAVVVTVALVVLTAALLRPASTAPDLGSERRTPAGIGGRADHRQHGRPRPGTDDPRNQHRQPRPALPGRRAGWFGVGCHASSPTRIGGVVHRRDVGPAGAGTSYDELDPTQTVSLDGYVSDTIAVTDYLRERFSQDKIYLVGQSWGTTLGVMAVQQRPDLYRAFVGTGQMVSQLASDRIFYEDTLAWAETTGDRGPGGTTEGCRTAALRGDVPLRDRAVARAGRVPLRPHRQLRGLGADVGEPAGQRVHPDRSGTRPRGVHGHLRRAVPPVAGCGLPQDSHRVRGADVLRAGSA